MNTANVPTERELKKRIKHIFPDSNILFHCKDLKELPWQEIPETDEVVILITKTVNREIDKKKQNSESERVRKKARHLNSLFRQILETEGPVTLCESPCRISISLMPPQRLLTDLPDFLDLNIPDDYIIAEVITYSSNHPNNQILLITNDTGLAYTAKNCNLSCQLADDEWLLPKENDTRDKKIKELENTVKELRSNYPDIQLVCENAEGNSIDRADIKVVHYKEILPHQIDMLLALAKEENPLATNFHENGIRDRTTLGLVSRFSQYSPPTQKQILEYQVKYEEWQKDLTKYYTRLPGTLEEKTHRLKLFFNVTNQGNVPAENVIIEFKIFNGLLIKPLDDDQEEAAEFPMPPRAPDEPEGTWAMPDFTKRLGLDAMTSVLKEYPLNKMITTLTKSDLTEFKRLNLQLPREKDRNSFYWKPKKPEEPSDCIQLECEEYRHKEEPETFEFEIVVPKNTTDVRTAVECKVSAKNLQNHVTITIPIAVTHESGDVVKEVQEHTR